MTNPTLTQAEKEIKAHMASHESRPLIREKVQLATMQSQRLYKRKYKRLSLDLFTIDLLGEHFASPVQQDLIEKTVYGFFEEIKTKLRKSIDQAQILIDKHPEQINSVCEYTNIKTFDIEINTPSVRRYIELLKLLDKFVELMDTLWFYDLVKKQLRVANINQFVNDIWKAANKARYVSDGLRDIRYNKNSDQENPENIQSERDIMLEALDKARGAIQKNKAQANKKKQAVAHA